MIEVEVKAVLDGFEGLEDKLVRLGAEKIGVEHQEDVYFNSPTRDFAVTDEALRIREINSTQGVSIVLTYKGAKLDDSSKTREELEVILDDKVNVALILERLGFKPVTPLRKDRIIYILDDYSISLDSIHGLGEFMEIEKVLKDGEDYQDSLDGIFQLYGKLGVTDGFERRSYLELLELHRKELKD